MLMWLLAEKGGVKVVVGGDSHVTVHCQDVNSIFFELKPTAQLHHFALAEELKGVI